MLVGPSPTCYLWQRNLEQGWPRPTNRDREVFLFLRRRAILEARASTNGPGGDLLCSWTVRGSEVKRVPHFASSLTQRRRRTLLTRFRLLALIPWHHAAH